MREPKRHRRPMTVEEYLRLEERSAIRHEYVAGQVYAMSGATTRHNRIALNIAAHLRPAARGGRCRVYMNDVKLRAGSDKIYYPDVMVDCTPGEEPELVVETPCVIVEVASRSTAVTDRREKLATYRDIPTLRAYLIVEQNRRRVTHHWRDADGAWVYATVAEGETIPVPCPETALTLDVIYEDVAMPRLRVTEPRRETTGVG